ncbi:hypothetical protein EC957_000849 [Mortierella hygrophila]|uniref:Histone deacetylation protein Rxt3 n=1 Tax=Mortierella hygrophila TaxID=979708 RepID=A0A9P6K2U1_9FUNG|nr:hypothetical protein EC957_000849 [Mortierella hygrophila]
MDTKKRSNEDLLDSDADPSPATTATTSTTLLPPSETTSAAAAITEAGDGLSSAMEVDGTKSGASDAVKPSPATHFAATMAAESMQSLGSEANKRVKLMMETNHTGSDFSPSIDLADPSQESKGLAEWVGEMDNDAHSTADTEGGAPSTKAEAKTDDTESAVTDSAAASEIQAMDSTEKVESAAGKEQTAGQDLVNALLAPTTEPSHEDLSGSILAVASLSEPLVTTLESLDNQADVNLITAAAPAASNLVINPELSESTVASEPEEGELESTDSDLTANGATNGADRKEDAVLSVAVESAAQGKFSEQSVARQDEKGVPTAEEGQLVQDQDIQMAEKPKSNADLTPSDAAIVTNQTKDAPMTATESVAENGTTDSQKPVSPTSGAPIPHEAVITSSPSALFKTVPPPALSTQEPPISSPTMARNTLSPIHPDLSRSAPMDGNLAINKPAQLTSLPPLSSIAGSPIHPVSQSARPSRSTMSVSALLLNNDDDSEQEQDRGRRTAGSMFDPFANPPSHNRSLSPPPVAPPQHSTLSGQHHQPGPGAPQHSSAPLPGQSVPPPKSLASVHRVEPPMSSHSDHSGYGRGMPDPSQSSRRSQDFTSAPGGGIRGASKDYPADEVMESGGVIGYGSQRHRLPSPVGARPHQEPLPGPGGTGGPAPPGSNKLPGLGSVTGGPPPPPPHSHDLHNRHRPMYRPEGNHPPPMNSGRPNSYSPNQHPNMTHSPPMNGHPHPHYPPNGPSHHHHSSGMVPNAPLPSLSNSVLIVERHVPRLIVKNDPSLKMNGRPELFLGYYRYDPAVLLPAMQGKENSLLEVRVASTYLTYDNAKVKKREVWGTDIYTDDSDVVAMLIHAGYYIPPTNSHCTDEDSLHPTSQHHNFVSNPIKHICPGFDLAVTLRVMPKLIKYQGSIRHRIKSRTWSTGHDGVSFKIESIRKLGAGEALNKGRSQSKRRMKEYSQERTRVLANIHDETTESLQNERAMRTATFEFTHQGDPCFKYSPELVMDRHDGLSRKWTSWRLKKEVLILENEEERYEISLQHQAGTDARRFDQYRFAVISPRTSLSGWSKASYPLDSADLTEVLYEDLDWQDFEWVERGVVIQPSPRGKNGATTWNGMEGVQPTSKDGDVDMEDGEIHDGTKDSAHQAATLSKADDHAQGSDDAHQEGVFCVVSRLYWRPMSENGPTRRTVTPATAKPAEIKSASVAALQNGPSKDVSDHHDTNAGQDKLLAEPVDSGAKTAIDTIPAKSNHEHSVSTPVASPVLPEDCKENKKEQVPPAPAVVECLPAPPPQQQHQQHQPQQQSTPTTATSSALEQQPTVAVAEPTKVPTVPAPAASNDMEAMEVDSSVITPAPAEPKVTPAFVAPTSAPTPTPVAVQQKQVEAVKPVPVVAVEEPPKGAPAAPVAAAVVTPVDEDEREEGELEEGEIASD